MLLDDQCGSGRHQRLVIDWMHEHVFNPSDARVPCTAGARRRAGCRPPPELTPAKILGNTPAAVGQRSAPRPRQPPPRRHRRREDDPWWVPQTHSARCQRRLERRARALALRDTEVTLARLAPATQSLVSILPDDVTFRRLLHPSSDGFRVHVLRQDQDPVLQLFDGEVLELHTSPDPLVERLPGDPDHTWGVTWVEGMSAADLATRTGSSNHVQAPAEMVVRDETGRLPDRRIFASWSRLRHGDELWTTHEPPDGTTSLVITDGWDATTGWSRHAPSTAHCSGGTTRPGKSGSPRAVSSSVAVVARSPTASRREVSRPRGRA